MEIRKSEEINYLLVTTPKFFCFFFLFKFFPIHDTDVNLVIVVIKNSTSVQWRTVVDHHFMSCFRGVPENFHRTWETPTFSFGGGCRRFAVASHHRYVDWSGFHHHPCEFFDTSVTDPADAFLAAIGIISEVFLRLLIFLFFDFFVSSLALVEFQLGPKRSRFGLGITRSIAVVVVVVVIIIIPLLTLFLLLGKPREEKRNSNRSRPPKRRFAIDEIGDSTATGRWGREERERGRGWSRRRWSGGSSATRTRAHVSAVRAERDKSVAEADRTDSVAAALGRVFWTFPDFFFFDVNRHFFLDGSYDAENSLSLTWTEKWLVAFQLFFP